MSQGGGERDGGVPEQAGGRGEGGEKPTADAQRRAQFARTAVAPPAPAAPRAPRTEITPPPAAARPAGKGRTEITPPADLARGTSARTEISPGPPPAAGTTPAPPPAAPLDELPLSEGLRVEQFELIRELGRGGMGQVFLARDTKLGRLVAIKFLGLLSADLTERFLVEARATARCQHENIVVIHEADEWHGKPYMVLEYLEGDPLSSLIAEGTVSPRRAIEIMVPVARALARAHELDIVHRDLKPDNIFVTRDGVVKVLDFGIAKLFESGRDGRRLSPEEVAGLAASRRTQEGGIVGTMPYMSPEQWGADVVDHRTDLWAVGIIFWELLTGRHPLDPITPQRLWHAAAMLEQPMPRIAEAMPEVPAALEQVIDRCLAKPKEHRLASARELVELLEQQLPGRYGRHLEEGESPYPGLSAFQESDADRFFGRSKEILQMVQRMREQPLVGVVGPSGVGKSSFVRAGVVPALRSSSDDWEVFITRPGRDPLAGLATLLQPLASTGTGDLQTNITQHEELLARLRSEPGFLGTLLRSRARQKRSQILLFVDQFEELYTLCPDAEERTVYTHCLAGVADDASTPLRVVVSMRSDFLDRAAEDRLFMDQLTRGLVFLPPVDADGMREALVHPLEMVGYRFESDVIVADMLRELEDTPGALPLLQFTAAKLWEARDRQQKLLTEDSYQALGGLAGALATHADEVLTRLAPDQQRLVKAIFQRLVTSDGTRAIVDVFELRDLAPDPKDVQSIVDYLVHARLLVVQSRGEQEGPAVEIVHESLITRWPTLRRWLEENQEDSAFLEQLRAAARQWDSKGRPVGLLWRGEAMDEARRFHRRFKGDLAAREREYLDAVVALATRSARRKRRMVVAAFVVLVGLVAAASVALFVIRDAQKTAEEQKELAEREAERAVAAEAETKAALDKVQEQMATIAAREAERDEAKSLAEKAEEKAATGEKKLAMTYEQLEEALAAARAEQARAQRAQAKAEASAAQVEKLAAAERAAKEKLESLLARERARVKELEKEKRKLSTKLK